MSCDVVFRDWCGYSLEEEVWEYTTLSLPECMSPLVELGIELCGL